MDWNVEARRILQTELARKGLTYKGLVRLLEGIGIEENEKSVANRIGRGTFSFAFFLQCMRALEVKVLRLPEEG
jgi:hypothetical protein